MGTANGNAAARAEGDGASEYVRWAASSSEDSAAQPQVQLRLYQADVIQRLRAAIGSGHRRPLLVAPTGAGKTVIASAIVHRAIARESRVLFLAHRRELIQQAADKLWRNGIDAGIIMAGYPLRPDQPVQVASVQTLWSRAHRSTSIERPPADLIIVDEAHRARARTYQRILEAYPGAVVLGLTATPCRGDGRGLGNAFDALVECPPIAELIGLGFLVPTIVYAPSAPDLAGIKVARGDYVETQLAERMDQARLVGDIVTHWHRLAAERPTVVFASSVPHSIHLRDQFRLSGVNAEHVDGTTPVDERDRILRQLAEGVVQVVCNYAVLTEGWDCPPVSCAVLARPTRQRGLYLQQVGRVLRSAPGKTDALVLDHAGATLTHGFVEDPVTWTLAEDKRADNPAAASRGQMAASTLKTCPECDALRRPGKPCHACGWRPTPRAAAVEVADGELERMDRSGRREAVAWDQAAFHRQLAWIAGERGYSPGWAAHKFREKFGCWPRARNVDPEPPSPALRAWVKSRQIAFAKAMEKAGRAA
ncbi:MAG: DEAD/DEAH box helicase [Azospirillaceae bacterium]